MSLDKLKLNKQLVTALQDVGISSAKELQQKTMSRILGGQDIIGIGPEGSGKTTTYVLAILMKLKFAFEEAPRAIVLTNDKESALAIEKQFEVLGKNTDVRTMCVLPGQGMETQREELAEGVDVVIGTPDRVLTLLLQTGLNMNKVRTLVLDNAEGLIRQGFKTSIHRISVATTKCQNIVFGKPRYGLGLSLRLVLAHLQETLFMVRSGSAFNLGWNFGEIGPSFPAPGF